MRAKIRKISTLVKKNQKELKTVVKMNYFCKNFSRYAYNEF